MPPVSELPRISVGHCCRRWCRLCAASAGNAPPEENTRRTALKRRPVEVVAHALEQRRAGDPGERRVFAAGALQIFRERQLLAHERAPGAQRPQHPKQQAVDVLGGDAADDAGLAQVGAPQSLQRFDFIGQLAQGFVDALGFAAGAGGAQAQLAAIQVQRGSGQWRMPIIAQVRVVGLIGQPQIDFLDQRWRVWACRSAGSSTLTPARQAPSRAIARSAASSRCTAMRCTPWACRPAARLNACSHSCA